MNKKLIIGFILILLIILASLSYLYVILNQSIFSTEEDYLNSNIEKETINKEPNIIVYSPKEGENLTFPFKIKGQARVFENLFNIRIIDEEINEIIYETTAMANAPDSGQFGEFDKIIDYLFKKPKGENIIIEVLCYSPKDGSELDKVSILANIKLENTIAVNMFFSNNIMDPQISCNKVFPIERIIPKTNTPAQKALELLLEGNISRDELEKGYRTNINYGVKINKLTIENNTAKADFSEQLEFETAGSCQTEAIRSQIAETLMQFPSVKDAAISINGNTEEILQP